MRWLLCLRYGPCFCNKSLLFYQNGSRTSADRVNVWSLLYILKELNHHWNMKGIIYATCPGDRVLVVVRFNVSSLHLKHWYENTCTCFSKDAESLKTYGCVLRCSPIVYTRPYSLNTTTAFYFVTGCSDIAVFVRLRVCHATTHSFFTWPWPVKELASYYAVMLYQVLRVSEQ